MKTHRDCFLCSAAAENAVRDSDEDSDDEYDDWDRDVELADFSICFDLKVALADEMPALAALVAPAALAAPVTPSFNCAPKSDLVQKIMTMTIGTEGFNRNDSRHQPKTLPNAAIILPEALHTESTSAESRHTVAPPSPFFHIDANGHTCFSKEEAARAVTLKTSFQQNCPLAALAWVVLKPGVWARSERANCGDRPG